MMEHGEHLTYNNSCITSQQSLKSMVAGIETLCSMLRMLRRETAQVKREIERKDSNSNKDPYTCRI